MSRTPDGGSRAALRLFLFLSCVYLATAGGHFYTGDGIEMFKTAESLVKHGDLVVRPGPTGRAWGYEGRGGERYSPYALGLSVLEAPLYAIARGVASLAPLQEPAKERLGQAAALSANAFVTAGTSVLILILLVGAGYSRRAAAGTALLYGLGTMAWVYAKHDFAEPLAAFCLLGAATFLVRAEGGRHETRALLLAGALNGYAFFTKYQMVLYTPLLLALLAHPFRERFRNGGALVRRAAIFLLPGLLFGLANLYVNHLRFETWLSTGYERQGEIVAGLGQIPVGLFGLLLSPGKGIFWYCPLLLALPFAWARFHARSPVLSWLGGGVIALTLAIFTPLWWWHGDWAWGPRYLLVALPFLALPLAALIDDGAALGRVVAGRVRGRHLMTCLLIAALAVNGLGLAVSFFPYIQALEDLDPPKFHDEWNFIPGLSPLRFHAHVVLGWARSALGGEIPDFTYRAWSEGEFKELTLRVGGPSGKALRPDSFFFQPRESFTERAIQGACGLALIAVALVLGAGVRRDLLVGPA